MKTITSIFKAPLFHFFILGVLLFVVYTWINPESTERNDLIHINKGQIKHFSERQAKRLNRAASQDELKALIDDYVITEMYYREGVKLGLDQNDPIIKRRVRQKIEMISNDIVSVLDVNDTVLQNYLDTHSDKFMIEAVYSFDQLYINPDKHHTDLKTYLEEVKTALNETGVAQTDSTMLPMKYEKIRASRIDGDLGTGFAMKLTELEPGKWSGPLESGFGLHFVKLTDKIPEETARLEDIREIVLREYLAQKRQEMLANQRKQMLKQYKVVIDLGTGTVEKAGTQ